LTSSGIFQMVRRRGTDAGTPELFPHMLRHTWRHFIRLNRGSFDDLVRLARWKSVSRAHRYGASGAGQRATAAAHRRAPGHSGCRSATGSEGAHEEQEEADRPAGQPGRSQAALGVSTGTASQVLRELKTA